MNYYVVGIRYPSRFNESRNAWEPSSVEANVDPDNTLDDAIALVREKLQDEGLSIEFAHHVTLNDLTRDVKDELIEAAGLPEENLREVDLVAIARDHKRDLRKHEVVS